MTMTRKVEIRGSINIDGIMDTAKSPVGLMMYHNIPDGSVPKAVEAAQTIRDFMANTLVPEFGLTFKLSNQSGILRQNMAGGDIVYRYFFVYGETEASYSDLEKFAVAVTVWGDCNLFIVFEVKES